MSGAGAWPGWLVGSGISGQRELLRAYTVACSIGVERETRKLGAPQTVAHHISFQSVASFAVMWVSPMEIACGFGRKVPYRLDLFLSRAGDAVWRWHGQLGREG